MFYSQFILAKKGPLGTIWIAAHLERKLRKNQVADTDIGVSVDSILFPDVPIALRLSSHLLLGVVRIYSKKVNYLFHDCSETLLKVKQAFRSTAVDLPPEESTAPYHSITLPETFDLDDFELPDNGLFEGNFVDHHISSREQITLQDTLNGMSYSTSQFGPDERFGDGESSHIGLDIDESLFADSVQTPMDIMDDITLEEHEGDAFNATPAATFSEMDIDGPLLQDGMQNHRMLPVPNDVLPRESIEEEVNDAENTCPLRSPSSEFAQAPSTPGLLQEAIPATYHDGPTLSPVRKLSPSNLVEGVVIDDGEISHLGDDPDPRKDENDLSSLPPESVPCTADQSDAKPESNVHESDKDTQRNVEEKTQPFYIPLEEQAYPEGLGQGLDLVGDPLDSTIQVIDSAVQSTNDGDLSEGVACINFASQPLLPCSSGLKENEVPHTAVHGLTEGFDSDNILMDKQEDCNCSDTVKDTDVKSPPPDASTMNTNLDKLDDTVMDIHLETIDREVNSNVLPPESFVSAPSSEPEIPNVMAPLHEVEIATETEKDDESLVYVSGKKRKVMEGTPILQISDSAKLSELPRSERDADFIPDDDDVLASILVGRKTPSLKLKPTPAQGEITTSKRKRLMPKPSQYKRKLLLDDSMVMHGDVIRQQLIHTEDIRRVRRKAPCSQLEIWIIENSHLAQEMFIEPLFSGASSGLGSLGSQKYEIIDNKLLESGVRTALAVSVEQDFTLDGTSVVNNEVTQEPSVLSLTEKEVEDCNDVLLLNTQEDQIGRLADSVLLKESENDHSLGLPGTAVDMQDPENTEKAECVNPEKDSISDLLNENLVVETRADLDVAKGGADMLLGTEEEKTECASQVNETTNYAYIAIDDKIEISVDENALSLTQEVYNGGALADSSEVVMPEIAENVNCLSTELVLMEVDLPICLEEGVEAANVKGVEAANAEETYNESDLATLSQCETDTMMESLDKGESQIQEVEDKDDVDGQMPVDTINDDLNPIFEDNHTEFLNLDDEAESEPVEEDENCPSTEQDRFFENSGWSSRTRAVARYLKSLFDNEDGHGRKVVPVDNLLAGKSRKEASRMFFETLVLKTKDYIHVEQDDSFGIINIKPRGKLVKSDF